MATTRRSRRHDGGSPQQPPHLRLTNPAHPHSLDPSDPALDPWSLTRHQRLAAHLDSLRPRRGLPVTLNPSDPRAPYLVDYNLDAELIANRWEYVPDEGNGAWLSLYRVPGFIRTALDRFRSRFDDHDTPGRSPVAAACLFYGTGLLASNPDVVRLIALRRALDRTDGLPPDTAEVYEFAVNQFSLTVDTKGMTYQPQLNYHVPSDIKQALSELASDLCLSDSILGSVAIAAALSAHHSALDPAPLDAAVATFTRRVHLRFVLLRAVLSDPDFSTTELRAKLAEIG